MEDYKEKNNKGRAFKTVIFEYKGMNHKHTFRPTNEDDYWEGFTSGGIEFDIHYCLSDNTIIVYDVSAPYKGEMKDVYSRKIK